MPIRKTPTTVNTPSRKPTFSEGQKSITTPIITDFKTKPEVDTRIHGLVGYNSNDNSVTVSIPGFERSTLDQIASNVHSPDLTPIEDIKNPDIKNQASVAEFENAKAKYEGGIRYNELIVWANKYAGSQFKALAEKAKAFASGLVSQSEIEKVYQQFLELQKQKSITLEKGVNYIAQSHKTATVQAALPYTIAENDANLKKQQFKAAKGYQEALKAEEDFDAFLKELGNKSIK
ncbi:hypothetical protein H6G33_37505 [Calothrix sp. FACHB-1219]|uniref:hypothetical protein n=1 Tax=unclassified Calothrix TaxID=2619626 RepID=UPI001685FCC3|nr:MULTISPECIES: hypothetical protein [unclassified Calothrix]MBD2208088.1 hypothetical protein [Calothrix sp. FACHB-168]MBD2222626.1 hypothetical protein [Calothrix sp. FACHB-1219]